MKIALVVLLIGFCLQGLVKFAVGFAVPYHTRVARIASYYRRDGRIISIYDSIGPATADSPPGCSRTSLVARLHSA